MKISQICNFQKKIWW